MTDTIKSRLEAADAECEAAARTELEELYEDTHQRDGTFRMPSPQAAEAILLRLVASKERAFAQVLATELEARPTTLDAHAASALDREVRAMLVNDRYLERMRDFFREAADRARTGGRPFEADLRRQDLLDDAYRLGVAQALHKARSGVRAALESHAQPGSVGDRGLVSQWRQYSTASPLRPIVTIALLSLTSYAIAALISSELVQGFLERFGWAAGTGL